MTNTFDSVFSSNQSTCSSSNSKPKITPIPYVKKKIFKEDAFTFNKDFTSPFKRPKRVTKNFEQLTFYNKRQERTNIFNCFPEKDLRIGKAYEQRIIEQEADNDVSTDEEQICKATRTIYISIRVAIEDAKNA